MFKCNEFTLTVYGYRPRRVARARVAAGDSDPSDLRTAYVRVRRARSDHPYVTLLQSLMLVSSARAPALQLLAALLLGSHVPAVSSGCRDPLHQPFAPTSIWNTPLGSGAQFAPTGMDRFEATMFHVDGNFVCHCQHILSPCRWPSRQRSGVLSVSEQHD